MNQPQTILLVDDSENDRLLMHLAFKKNQCPHPVQEVHNGEQAIAYLKGDGAYADRGKFPLPIVMLLDLNMPRKNGFDVLTWVRAQPGLKRLAIFVLTASLRKEDLERAFDLGATAFLVKPSTLETLAHMLQSLCAWIKINQYPSLHDASAPPKPTTKSPTETI